MPSSPPIPPSPGAPPNGWPACGRTTPASRTAPTARAGGRSIPITNGPGRPCWRSRTSWRACSRRRAVMPCGAPYPARTAPRHAPAGAGRAAGGLRLRPAWHRRLAWRHRRLPQRHREIRALTLPDGTRLTLSTGTAIDLRFDANARLVLLLAGEILVATAPDPAATPRPFRVRGRHGTVQALGTRFTVREDDEDARVAVFEGAVEIRPAGAPDAAIRLDAGQGSRFPATGPTRPPRSARTRHPGAEACWWPTPGGWTTSWPSWAATGPACCAATRRRGPARERRVSAARHRPGAAQPGTRPAGSRGVSDALLGDGAGGGLNAAVTKFPATRLRIRTSRPGYRTSLHFPHASKARNHVPAISPALSPGRPDAPQGAAPRSWRGPPPAWR